MKQLTLAPRHCLHPVYGSLAGRSSGFTLLELLIAIFVTAMLAAGTVALVFQFSLTNERVTERLHELERLQAAKTRLQEDFEQFAPQRPVADEFNNVQPALIHDEDTLLSLTRHGWVRSQLNPAVRSDFQRVDYELVPIREQRCRMGLTSEQWSQRDDLTGHCLVRRHRQHLEAEADNPWREQVILAPVDSMTVTLRAIGIDGATTEHGTWPPSVPVGEPDPESLQAVTVALTYGGFATAEFTWLVPGAILPPEEEAS